MTYRNYDEWRKDNPLRQWRINQKRPAGRGPGIPAHMTQPEVAAKLGVSPQAVKGWEHGHSMPAVGHATVLRRLIGDDIIDRLKQWKRQVPA